MKQLEGQQAPFADKAKKNALIKRILMFAVLFICY
jgi:hypothetical protein